MLSTMFVEKFALPDKEIGAYTGMAFDGGFLFFVNVAYNCVTVYDRCYNYIKRIQTANGYANICYDGMLNCFWATTGVHKIYKLDPVNFCEIDDYSVSATIKTPFVDLALNRRENCLIVLQEARLLSVNKSGKILATSTSASVERNNAICCVDDLTIKLSSYFNGSLCIIKSLGAQFSSEHLNCLPKSFVAKSIVHCPDDTDNCMLILANKSNRYSYVLKYAIKYPAQVFVRQGAQM